MRDLKVTGDVERARSVWRYRGQARPSFALATSGSQLSVWDFPRPPRIEKFDSYLRVELAGQTVASTSRGRRVLETAGAPTYYFPPEDVLQNAIERTGIAFHCEWKGISHEITVASIMQAGWVLEAVYPDFRELCGWYAFYPQKLDCFVNEERAGAQPGGYYGGWVTRDIVGPIKGEPGTESW